MIPGDLPRRAWRTAVVSVMLASSLAWQTSPAFAKRTSVAEQCARTAEEGQRSRAQGALRASRESFQTCARKGCPRAVQADCARWMEEVTESQPTVVIHAYGKDKVELESPRVSIDDADVVASGLALPLDPGAHVIRLRTDDGTVEQRVVLAEGEKNRVVSLTLAPKDPPVPPPPPPPKAAPVPVLTYALGGGAIVMLGTGAILWGVGASDHSALAASCAPGGTCSRSAVSSAKTELIVGDVLVAASVVLAAGAVYFFFTRKSDNVDTTAFEPVVRF